MSVITFASTGFKQWVQDVRQYSESHPLVHQFVHQLVQNYKGVIPMTTIKITDSEALASVLAGKEEVEVEISAGSFKKQVNLQRVVNGELTLMGVGLPMTAFSSGTKFKNGSRFKVQSSGEMVPSIAPKAKSNVTPGRTAGCTSAQAAAMSRCKN